MANTCTPLLQEIARAANSDDITDQLVVLFSKEAFIGELELLAYKFVPGKMAEFMKEIQDKDIPNLMKLQILGREFELRVREKDLFIEKLKGNMDN
nr:hypothetical protein [Tanacetum cinerariifolium]